MVFCTNKSLAVKKLHIYFNFISFQEIFIEHLLPGHVWGTECANMNKRVPLRNGEGSAQENTTLGTLSRLRFNVEKQMLRKSREALKGLCKVWLQEWVPEHLQSAERKYQEPMVTVTATSAVSWQHRLEKAGWMPLYKDLGFLSLSLVTRSILARQDDGLCLTSA